MTAFYQLSPEQLGQRYRALARLALPDWGIPADAPMQLLKVRENGIFAVTRPDDGKKFVIRVHRAGYHSDAELRSELQWMAALTDFGIETPPIIPALDGEPLKRYSHSGVPEERQVDVVGWVSGEQLGRVDGDSVSGDDRTINARFALLGETLARMHNQAETWQPPAGFTRHAWDVDGLVGDQPFWGRFWELPALDDSQRRLIIETRQRLRKDLACIGTGPDRYGMIHADLVPENVLADGQRVRVIDFDDAGFGWYLFDISTALFWLQWDPRFSLIERAFYQGYREQRPLSDEHMAWFPVINMARATTYYGWMYTRSETETAREMTPMVIEAVTAMADAYLQS